jgi:metal-responsive CopG/Arc/MetJ family transcriptional regulator
MASRNISISLPDDMIQQATQLAKREHRTLSELFREAFRVYRAQQMKKALDEASQRQEEVTRIAKEIRAQLEPEPARSESEEER